MATPENPPAFPLMHGMEFISDRTDAPDYQVGTRIERGMTLRDHFAAAALTGLLANSQPDYNTGTESASHLAYGYADAMLTEREKGGR